MAKRRKAPRPQESDADEQVPTAGGRPRPDRLSDDLRQEVLGVALAAAGVWSLFALADSGGGTLGTVLADGLKELFGVPGAWVAPILTLALGGYLVYLRRGFKLNWRFVGWFSLFLVLVAGSELLHHREAIPASGYAVHPDAGGMVGWAVIMAVHALMGDVGRWIVLVVLAWAGFLMATHISVADFLKVIIRAFLILTGRAQKKAAKKWAEAKHRRLMDKEAAYFAEGDDGPAVISNPGADRDTGHRVLVVPAGTKPLVDGPLSPRGAVGLPAAVEVAASKALGVVNTSGDTGVQDWILNGPTAEDEPRRPAKAAGRAPELAAESTVGVARKAAVGVEGAPRPTIAAPAPVDSIAGVMIHRPEDQPPAADDAEPKITLAESLAKAPKTAAGGAAQLSLRSQLGQPYQLPSLSLLPLSEKAAGDSVEAIRERMVLLEHTLETFGVKAKVTEVHVGPAITRFELQPAPGVRVNKITALADDIALNLAAADVRIQAPIPGKAAIGIEVPNRERAAVLLRDVLESPDYKSNPSRLAVGLGKDIAGKAIIGDLGKMPHILIAGSTGSGKSVCMNTLICSILMKARPDEVKMLMIDPKRVELAVYEGVPHLAAPVVTDPRKAAGFLKWAVKEMETRYDLFAISGVRDITRYNQLVLEEPGPDPENPRKPLPYIVIFIDELADLMMVAPGDVEDSICRLAQMARACGMHLVVATQRPSVDVITGLIKANIPSRIAFAVSSQVDSRTILDGVGAEKLLGRGDMLYNPVGASHAVRAQGCFISEKEVEKIVSFVRKQGAPEMVAEPLDVPVSDGGKHGADKEPEGDPVFPDAVRVVIEHGQASVSILQRRLRLNYTKAARLIDDMEQAGFIGPHQGPKPREVLISLGMWEQRFGSGRGGAHEETAAADEGGLA